MRHSIQGRIRRALLVPLVIVLELAASRLAIAVSSSDVSPECRSPAPAISSWTELYAPARTGHSSVVDTRRHRLVLFGGRVNQVDYHNDVWVLPLRGAPRWERLTPLGDPPSARIGSAAVYDRLRDRMLIIGGLDANVRNDVWELSFGRRARWRRLSPSGESLLGRYGHTITPDRENDRLILFGGWSEHSAPKNDVWQLSLSDPIAWTRLVTIGAVPPARAGHTAVYSPDLHGVLVFGGSGSCRLFCDLDDTWLLSTQGVPAWTELTASLVGDRPGVLQGHSAVYDEDTKEMIVFGGEETLYGPGYEQSLVVRALSVRDRRWTELVADEDAPRPRTGSTAVMDPTSGRAVIHGGELGFGTLADTWAFSRRRGTAWSPIVPAAVNSAPLGADGSDMVYDPVGHRLVLYWDGSVFEYSFGLHGGWERMTIRGDPPPGRSNPCLVYDPRRNRVILHGGVQPQPRGLSISLNDTWALSLGPRPTWSRLTFATAPPERALARGAYDSRRDRMIMFGGDSTGRRSRFHNDVWALDLADSGGWTLLASDTHREAPRSRAGGSVIYDATRDRLVIFGGGFPGADGWEGFNDTWAFSLSDSGQWRLLDPGGRVADKPEKRAFQATVYDAFGERMIVVGGYLPGPFGTYPDGAVWSFDLAQLLWSRLTVGGSPAPIWFRPAAAFDSRNRRMLVSDYDYLWALELNDGGARHRPIQAMVPETSIATAGPAVQATLALAGARANPSTGPLVAEFSLPDAAPASLGLFDLAGRRMWSREVGSLGAGAHRVAVSEAGALRPGLYFLRLMHGREARVARVTHLP